MSLGTVKNVKTDQPISIKQIRVPGVATKQRRVDHAVLTVKLERMRHIRAVAIPQNASQVKVNSEADVVQCSRIVVIVRCDACSKAKLLNYSF